MNKCTNTNNEQTGPRLYVDSFHNVFISNKEARELLV